MIVVRKLGVPFQPELAMGAIARTEPAQGSGSSRHSSRNRSVAPVLHQAGMATLLFDLLTARGRVLSGPMNEIGCDQLLCRRMGSVVQDRGRLGDEHDDGW